ncbi:hemolysin III family channel protein [Allomyces macrogynus ATCC 38327]|uniref:Hemolysin III family channel protein n=1 Tax=Allomyces macrogynus (strain ATCC 38327) TaxID=578462 RepID=A0A0L0SZS4_ALLM3|nr:hemolysin III family channel protein [Allomyces macrogynus ATCC 38327]|eukprot:KNE67976.1 hemolysin III family channel protein [Allomyces macrogynus ATCC 38327]
MTVPSIRPVARAVMHAHDPATPCDAARVRKRTAHGGSADTLAASDAHGDLAPSLRQVAVVSRPSLLTRLGRWGYPYYAWLVARIVVPRVPEPVASVVSNACGGSCGSVATAEWEKKEVDNANDDEKTALRYYRYHEIPAHLQDNEYIHTGYRAFYSHLDCLRSMAHMHNETVNIWSHLLGGIAFAIILAFALDTTPSTATSMDRSIMSLYHATAAICLVFSGFFHTFFCHAHAHVYDRMAILDFTGIATLLFGSFTALVYFAFRPHPTLLPVPLAITAVSAGTAALLPWFAIFRSHHYRTLRTSIMLVLGTAMAAALVWSVVHIWDEVHGAWQWTWGVWIAGTVASYVGGAAIYATRFPECLLPGKFDLVGSSHQLWHMLVMVGAYCHWQVLVCLRDWRLAEDLAAAIAGSM